MAIVIPIFMWGDLQRMAHYLAKKLKQRKVKKQVQAVRHFDVLSALVFLYLIATVLEI